jgi:hypothetical protein
LELKRAKEENLDWFRERQRKETNARAAHDREVLERKAQRIRQEWEQECLEYAFRCVPGEAPEDIRLPVSQSVREALADLSPSDSEEVVGQMIGAAVEKALRPWRRSKEVGKAVQDAKEQLPYWARGWSGSLTQWELQAMQAARRAIAQFGDDATFSEMRAAAITAGKEVAGEYNDAEAKRLIVEGIFLLNARDQQEKARQAVRSALEELPIGSSRAQMEQVRDEALAPFKAADEAAGAQARAAKEADLYLFHVDIYLQKIAAEACTERNLGSPADRYQLAQRLKEEFRPILIEEILNEPLTLDDAHSLIEALVNRRL